MVIIITMMMMKMKITLTGLTLVTVDVDLIIVALWIIIIAWSSSSLVSPSSPDVDHVDHHCTMDHRLTIISGLKELFAKLDAGHQVAAALLEPHVRVVLQTGVSMFVFV